MGFLQVLGDAKSQVAGSAQARGALVSVDRAHSFSVEYDPGVGAGSGNQIEWFVQDGVDVAIYPAGTSVNGARIADGGIPELSRSVSLESNSCSVADVVFRVADLDGAASLEIARKWANRNSGRNAIVRYYCHDRDRIDPSSDLRATFVLDAPTWHRGALFFRCTDIQREAIEQDVMREASWRLVTSLTDNAGKRGEPTGAATTPAAAGQESGRHVIIYGPDPRELMVEHSEDYAENPGATVLYLETPEGEVIAIDEVAAVKIDLYDCWRCRIVTRGVFRSVPAAVPVDADRDGEGVAIDNLPEMGEVIYYAEPAASLLTGLLTRAFLDGRTMPAAHTHGLDAFAIGDDTQEELVAQRLRWIDVASLAGADLDFPLRLRNPGTTKLLDLVESEVLSAMGGILVPDATGRLAYRAIPSTTPDAPYVGVLSATRSNLDEATIGELGIETANRADPIIVKTGYDWRTETFLDQPSYFRTEAAELVNGDVAELELEYRCLGGGFLSDAQRHAIARRKAEVLAYPTITTSADSALTRTDHDVLDVVRIESDKVRDPYTGLPYPVPLGRSFVVVAVRKNYETGRITYSLQGSTGKPEDVRDSFLEQHLEDSWYDQYPRLVDRLTRTSGAVGYANGELSGGGHLIAPGIYSHAGDLRIRSDFWASTGGFNGDRIMLVVRGELRIESPNPWRVTGAGSGLGGRGGTASRAPERGGRGFVGGGATGQPITITPRYRLGPELNSDADKEYIRTSKGTVTLGRPITTHSGAHQGALPAIPLALNSGELVGLPARLSGAGGHGAPAHTWRRNSREGQIVRSGVRDRGTTSVRTLEEGGRGGNGGMAIVYISRSGGFVGSGGTDTSGADTVAPGSPGFRGAVGMPGWPGAAIWLIDGGQQKSLPDPSRFVCRIGAALASGATVNAGDVVSIGSDAAPTVALQGPEVPLSGVDIWRSMTLVAHVPAPARVADERRYTGAIDEFFDTQPDGAAKLFVEAVRPGNANFDDAWITPDELKSRRARPRIEVLFKREGWRTFDWEADRHAGFYASLISLYRDYGTTEWYYSEERPVVFSPGSAWTRPSTGQTWIIYGDGRPDVLAFEQGARVGENQHPDIAFEEFLAGRGGVIVLDNADTTPRFPPFEPADDISSTEDPNAGATLPAPQGGYWDRYSSRSGAVTWTPVPASALPGAGFQYRIRRASASDVVLDGRATNNLQVRDLGPDELTFLVRIEAKDGSAYGRFATIVRAAEAGGSSSDSDAGSGSSGSATLTAPTNGRWNGYSSTSGQLVWDPVSESNAPGGGYRYRLERVGHSDGQEGIKDGRATNSFEQRDLDSGTTRAFRLRLELDDGSAYSNWLNLTADTR